MADNLLDKIKDLESRIDTINSLFQSIDINYNKIKPEVDKLEKEKNSLEEELHKIENFFFNRDYEFPFYHKLIRTYFTNDYNMLGNYLKNFLNMPENTNIKKLGELFINKLEKLPKLKLNLSEFEKQVLYYFTKEENLANAYTKLMSSIFGGDEAKIKDELKGLFVSDDVIVPNEEIQKEIGTYSKKASLLLNLSLLLRRYNRPSFAIDSMCDHYSQYSSSDKDPLGIKWILDIYDVNSNKEKYNEVFSRLFGIDNIGHLLVGMPEFLDQGEGKQLKHLPYLAILSSIEDIYGEKIPEYKMHKPTIDQPIYVLPTPQMLSQYPTQTTLPTTLPMQPMQLPAQSTD